MIFGIIALIVIVLIVLWGVSAYNGLVTLRNRVKNGWAQIDVQLKQRADLIPNLVETVKGYAAHESQRVHTGDPGPRQRHSRRRSPVMWHSASKPKTS